MAKIIVTREGVVEQTVQLSKERITLGRHRHNDVVLNHPSVSGEHAVITTILDDSFLEDLHSTNGTFVNGHRIGKHFLQTRDMIKMAKYTLEFLADGIRPSVAAEAAAPAVPAPPPSQFPARAPTQPVAGAANLPMGQIEVLNGPNQGKVLALTKAVTSLGRPGVQVVVIARTPEGYSAAHAEGEHAPLVNGVQLGRSPQRLSAGDVLDLSGTQMAFRLAAGA